MSGRRNNGLQRKPAVIVGCSWLLFVRRHREKPSFSAAEANTPTVISLHLSANAAIER